MFSFKDELEKYGESLAVDELSEGLSSDEIQDIKHNENARNLLGLIEFQRGELGEAMKHWSISEYYNKNHNKATYYLREIKKEPELLTKMNESIHLYNEAMGLAQKGSIDFALAKLRKAVHLSPQYVKAQLLLALCYIENQHFKTALRVLDQVLKLEPLNPEASRYRSYIARKMKEGALDAGSSDIQDLSSNLYIQQSLTEPDKAEIFKEGRQRRRVMRNLGEPLMQLALFFAGALCCFGFMRTLLYPDQIRELEDQVISLELSQSQLREEKEELQQEIANAGQILMEISESGTSIGAGLKADIGELLIRWEMWQNES